MKWNKLVNLFNLHEKFKKHMIDESKSYCKTCYMPVHSGATWARYLREIAGVGVTKEELVDIYIAIMENYKKKRFAVALEMKTLPVTKSLIRYAKSRRVILQNYLISKPVDRGLLKTAKDYIIKHNDAPLATTYSFFAEDDHDILNIINKDKEAKAQHEADLQYKRWEEEDA